MQDKKVIALIVLTVLAVASLIYGVTASPKGRAKSAAAKGQVVATPSQSGASAALPTARRAKRSQYKTWKRSPFVSGQASSSPSELTLTGIIWNKSKPKAMIGDAIVSKGDTIGENKVIDIQPNKVILNDGTKDFELQIEK